MSYKKKKLQKSKFSQFKYGFGLIKLALLKQARALFQKEGRMRLKQTIAIVEFLRKQNKIVRPNNKKVDEWVDGYINDCILNGKPVEILTQWCISKDLEQRYQIQGQKFVPTKAELELVQKEIPRLLRSFSESGVVVNWWITLNRSYLDSGRINLTLENEYRVMIEQLLKEYALLDLTVFNWEDDILNSRPKPATQVLEKMSEYISKGAFQLELNRHSAWARDEAGLIQTDEELEKDVKIQIACEVEEGRLLTSNESPFSSGNFIMVPLEVAERYVFFSTLVPEFPKRIVSVLKPYPWRMND